MKNKKIFIISFIAMTLFVVLTFLLSFSGVRVDKHTGKEIGMYSINEKCSYFEYNATFDKLSDVFLVLSIALVALFAFIGLVQIIKRKSLFKVDKDIVVFGLFFVLLAFLWIAFDKFLVINYRPILIEGNVEPSYPSTHILVVSFTMISSVSLICKYLKNKKMILGVNIIFAIIISLTFILRLAAGMHWFTDCLGGLLLGISLSYLYIYFK